MSENQMTTETQREEKLKKLIQILPKKTPEQVLSEIKDMVGMEQVKKNAVTFLKRNKLESDRRNAGWTTKPRSQHTVFTGNPGTGKTTMARLRAELLYSLGLAGEKYLELSREKIVGEFIGSTEANITKMLEGADQIFIDEAYALVDGAQGSNDFGQHVVSALITALENDRNNLVVMFAGYPEEMKEFLATNPGFSSRVSYYEHFEDYSIDELALMLVKKLAEEEYVIQQDALELAITDFAALKEKVGERDFGNARLVRTVVEQVPDHISNRLYPDLGEEAQMSQDEVEESIAGNGKISQLASGLFTVEGAAAAEGLAIKDYAHDREALRTVVVEDVQSLNIVSRGVQAVEKKKRQVGFSADREEEEKPDFAEIAKEVQKQFGIKNP